MPDPAPPRASFPAGVVAAALAAGAIAAFGGLTSYSVTRALNQTTKDPYDIQATAERMAQLRSQVPENATVGYVSDVKLDTDAGKAVFFAAQYALAPRLLVDARTSRNFEYVLGNFSMGQDYEAIAKEAGLTVVQDFGRGAVLFRKGSR